MLSVSMCQEELPGPSQVGLVTAQGAPGHGDFGLLPHLVQTYCKPLHLPTPAAPQNDKPVCRPVGQNESRARS